jgi:hypothetical protein
MDALMRQPRRRRNFADRVFGSGLADRLVSSTLGFPMASGESSRSV